MLRKNRSSSKIVAEINVVPYIDVMLVLLVIFIVTAPLLQQGVAVDLPQASAKALPPAEKEPIVISVDKKGEYYLNIADNPHVPMDRDALVLRIMADKANNPERKVLVKADNRVSYGKVISAMVLAQRAGADSVGLVTQNEPAAQASGKQTAASHRPGEQRG